MTEASGDLAGLLARVQRLEDEQAIRSTFHRYCHAVDVGDEAGWVDTFMPDGKLETHDTQTGGSTRPLIGHEWLSRMVARHTRAPERWHQHQITNSLITVDGDTARSESYWFLLMENEGRREVECFGRYYDLLSRCPDGRWRFQERIIHVDSGSGASTLRPKPVG